jgi:hypothetical protein
MSSNSYDRRIIETKEKTFRSNHWNSLSSGQFSTTPKGLIDMMARLNVNKEHLGVMAERHETQDKDIHDMVNLVHKFNRNFVTKGSPQSYL